ncbi:hypothetical protein Tco_0084304 [Tanacetum coccineum]
MSGGGTQNNSRKAISAIKDNTTVNLAKQLLSAPVDGVPVMAASVGSPNSKPFVDLNSMASFVIDVIDPPLPSLNARARKESDVFQKL